MSFYNLGSGCELLPVLSLCVIVLKPLIIDFEEFGSIGEISLPDKLFHV